MKELNTLTTFVQENDNSYLLHSSGNLFLRLEFPQYEKPQILFPSPVPVQLTLYANMSSRPKPNGIRILWSDLEPVHNSPISHLSQTLLKESVKMESFKIKFAEKKDLMNKKCNKLMGDLKIFAKEKKEMKSKLLKKSLLLINQKKIKILDLSKEIENLKQKNEKLQKELVISQSIKRRKKGKKKVKQK